MIANGLSPLRTSVGGRLTLCFSAIRGRHECANRWCGSLGIASNHRPDGLLPSLYQPSYQGIKRPLAGQGPEPQKFVNAPLSGGHAFFVRRHAAQFRDNESFQLETALRSAVLCLTRTICCRRGAFLFALAIIKAGDSFNFHSSLTAVLKQLEVVWPYISRVRLLD